jgi:hypothetical protein
MTRTNKINSLMAAAFLLWCAGAVAADKNPVRMSVTGVCYDPAQTSERATLPTGHFATLEDCLKAGGRAAKGEPKAAAAPVAKPVPAAKATLPETPSAPLVDKAIMDTDDPNIVKLSRSGICHDQSSGAYEATLHYRAYRSLRDCLDSGGKPAR